MRSWFTRVLIAKTPGDVVGCVRLILPACGAAPGSLPIRDLLSLQRMSFAGLSPIGVWGYARRLSRRQSLVGLANRRSREVHLRVGLPTVAHARVPSVSEGWSGLRGSNPFKTCFQIGDGARLLAASA